MDTIEEEQRSNPFDEELQSGKRFDISRTVLQADTDGPFKNFNPHLKTALKLIADNDSLKGFVIVWRKDRPYFKIIWEPYELEEEQRGNVEISRGLIELNIMLSNTVAKWEEMNQRPFEEVEAALRSKILKNKKERLEGIFRFID